MQMLLGFQMLDVLYAFSLVASAGVGRLSPCCPLFSDALPLLSAGSTDYMIWPSENLGLLFTTYDGFARSRVNALIRGHWHSFQGLQNYRSGTQNIINISECFRSCCDTPSGFLPVHLKLYVCRLTAQLGVAPGLLRLFLSPCPHEDPADALETNRKLHSFVQHQSVWSGSKRIKKYRSWISMKMVQLKDIERFWKNPYTDPLPLRIRKDL